MSKEIDIALKNLRNRFHQLSQRNQQTGEYNFYIKYFREQTDGIDDALDSLVNDKTGYFEEFAFDQMHDEVLELVRAICNAEIYTTYFAYYNPMAIFPKREMYIEDEKKRAIEARKKLNEHYAKLAVYYAGQTTAAGE